MQPMAGTTRDLRADLFRGIALWFIFIDHVPGNALGWFTLRNIAFADATELFVFLAGYAGGIAYGRQMERDGWLFAAARVMGRVGTLYVAHIFLFVVFTAQVGFSAARLDRGMYLDELQMDALGADPYQALLHALLLSFQPAFLNILPLYVALMAIFALVMPLLRWPWLLLGLSALGYALVRATGINLPSVNGEGWYFNPFAWQILYMCGAVVGFAPHGGRPILLPWRWWGAALCALLLLPCAGTMLAVWHAPDWLAQLPGPWATFLDGVDKTALHPLRLLSLLALAYLAAHLLPRGARLLEGRLARLFILLGQQSLPVFCAGIFLSFLGRLALEADDRGPMQLAVNVAGLAALAGVAWLSRWYDRRVSGARKPLPLAPVADRA
ncbi:OpgC domain-containing protein [Rhodovarius crocodyli]|uniref:OpgC domain-containing protein n=1 Tax=Rhodovarius crocodyli TaxID=1979269 RepID=A0A437MNJ1_9PROT|nr:OpgC domain-containing protein [Rhodovarius crocodyli]RVT99199.1 OpgC domain-containing protein [Rhodovarius crocodyli]